MVPLEKQTYSLMYYRQALQSLKAKRIAPAYLIFGEENYLVDDLLERIPELFLPELQREMNFFVRYAPDTSLEEIAALAAGSSLFSDKKVIIYKNVENLRSLDIAPFKKYLEHPDPNICLLLVARVDSISAAKFRKISQLLQTVRVTVLREADLVEFVQENLRKQGKSITADAARLLIYLAGDHLQNLKNQIDQLVQFSQGENITSENIEQVVGMAASRNIFEFTRQIATRKLNKGLFTLHNLLEKGESPQSILYLLIRHFTILWKIRGYYASGEKNDSLIQRELKIYPRHFSEYKKQVYLWRTDQIEAAMKLLARTDRALKSGRSAPDLLLDILTYNLINL